MSATETVATADIYVPKRRATLDQKRVGEIATGMLDKGQQAPTLKACIGWKPLKRSVKKLFSVSLSTRGGANDAGG